MPERDPIRDIVGTCAAQIGAITTAILSPLIISGLIVGLAIGEIEAGGLITFELLVIGLGSMLLAPLMSKLRHHLVAICGAVILISAHYLSAESASLDELYLWRLLGGLGTACLVATANAAIAQARKSTLLYGLAWATAYTVTAILAVLLSESGELISFDVIYKALAIAMVLILPLLWLVPRHSAVSAQQGVPAGSFLNGTVLLLGIIFIGISMMAYYAYLGQLVLNIDASSTATGWIVALAQIAGIAGGLLSAPVASRLGVIRALVLTSVLHTLAISLAISTSSIPILGFAVFCEAVLFIIMIPLMLTLSANIDKKGRWAAAAGGAFTLSTAFGPILGAWLIEYSGYTAIVWLQFIATIPAILIFIRVNRLTTKNGEQDGSKET